MYQRTIQSPSGLSIEQALSCDRDGCWSRPTTSVLVIAIQITHCCLEVGPDNGWTASIGELPFFRLFRDDDGSDPDSRFVTTRGVRSCWYFSKIGSPLNCIKQLFPTGRKTEVCSNRRRNASSPILDVVRRSLNTHARPTDLLRKMRHGFERKIAAAVLPDRLVEPTRETWTGRSDPAC